MLNLNDSRNLSRRFPALCLVLFPILYLVGDLLFAGDATDTASGLAEIAVNQTRYQIAFLCFLLGTVLAVWGLIGVLHLLRGPGLSVGQLGAGLIMLGLVVATSFFGAFPLYLTAATTPGLDQGQLVTLFDGTEGVTISTVLIVMMLLGLVGGSLLLALGLWLRRAVPVWAPVALAASTVIGFVNESLLLGLVENGLLLVALAAVAYRMFTLTDEQWTQWRPLPERSAATADA
jgi:hypothetical protein